MSVSGIQDVFKIKGISETWRKFNGATRLGATGLRASEREICRGLSERSSENL